MFRHVFRADFVYVYVCMFLFVLLCEHDVVVKDTQCISRYTQYLRIDMKLIALVSFMLNENCFSPFHTC